MTKKAKPIIFSPPMVQAIIEGRKTMTRRVPCKNPYMPGDILWVRERWRIGAWDEERQSIAVDYKDEQRKEWLFIPDTARFKRYVSQSTTQARNAGIIPDGNGEYRWEPGSAPTRWRPPIYMPREVSRIFLRVTASRPERLADISVEDAIAEGCTGIRCEHPNIRIGICTDCYNHGWLESPTAEFFGLWESLNGKRYDGRYSIKNDPWVWAYTFERISKEEAEA